MNKTTPLNDIINKPRQQPRNNSPYLSQYNSKRPSQVSSQASNYNDCKKPDEKTLDQLYHLFKKQGLENVNGLVKFLEGYQPRRSISPIIERERFSSMIVEAKHGLNQLQNRINTFSNKSTDKGKYKNLISEDEEHEYLYDNKSLQYDYKKMYLQSLKDKDQMNNRINELAASNETRDQIISQLQQQIQLFQFQMKDLLDNFTALKTNLNEKKEPERSISPKPSISNSASDYTFTLQVCNSEPDIVPAKDYYHTQSQQLKRS